MITRRRAVVGVVLAIVLVALVLVLRSPAAPVQSASCVPSDDEQGWTYANYYLNRVAHPPVHWQYPEIRLTWRAMANAEGYYIEADDPYTAARFTDWPDEIFATTYTHMPLHAIVGPETTSITFPNLASQARYWRVHAIIGGVIQSTGVKAAVVCGMQVMLITGPRTPHCPLHLRWQRGHAGRAQVRNNKPVYTFRPDRGPDCGVRVHGAMAVAD